MARSHKALSTALIAATIASVLPMGLFTYTCFVPVDVSGSPTGGLLPPVIREFKNRDEVAYPLHLLLGRALEGARCNPVAAGFQLIKAGAHANTREEVTNAGA